MHTEPGLFPNTQWSLVARAGMSAPAFGALLQKYREPLIVFLLSKLRCSREDAEDAVSAMYAGLISLEAPLENLNPARGKFRTWLMTCAERELLDAWRKAAAVKRGGGQAVVSLEAAEVQAAHPGDDPAEAYERAWAQAVMAAVMERFLAEAGREGALEHRIRRVALGEDTSQEQALADEFGVSRRTVTRAKQAARARFRRLLLEEVSSTVDETAEVEEEMQWLGRQLV